MKTICIYHSIDLDGWMSAAIIKLWNQKQNLEMGKSEKFQDDNLDFLGFNYSDDIPDLSDYDRVIMCDISFPVEEMMSMHLTLLNNFIWIDHHKSAINDIIKFYDEALEGGITDGDSIVEKYGYPMGNRKVDYAACELTWMLFFPTQEMPEIVRMLGRYDCFGHKGTNEEQEVLEFQYAARTVISNYEHAYYYLNSYLQDDRAIIEALPEDGSAIYGFLCTEAKQSYKNGFKIYLNEPIFKDTELIDVNVRKFICINKERFNPINFGINYHDEGYDGAACFHYANGMYNFSLYNDNGLVDCSVIAKNLGGGGHKGAAGFRVKNINNIIDN